MDEADEYGDELDKYEVPKLTKVRSSVNEEGLPVFDMNFVQSLLEEESKSAKKEQRVLGIAKIANAEAEMVQLGAILSKLVKYLKALNRENESAINKQIYSAMYNMLMTILANVDFRAIKTGEKQNVIDLLNEIAAEILEGPF